MDSTAAALVALARDDDSPFEVARTALTNLLALDETLAVAVAFDILAGEPREKPSRGLLIDPTDSARRRWCRRVAAGAALVGSPSVRRVFDEIRDELAESPDLAAEVLARTDPHAALSAAQHAALLALRP